MSRVNMRAGIPRCLSYYYLGPLYSAFLEGLGIETLTSQRTTAKDLENLSLCPTDEPCISVKVAFGHCKNLIDAGSDVIFLPRVVSLNSTGYCCPKMMGLPSMLQAGLEMDSRRMVSPVIDMKDNPRRWGESWIRAAFAMGVKDPRRAAAALEEALRRWRDSQLEQVVQRSKIPKGATAVVGHAYVLDDVFAEKVSQVAGEYGPVVRPEMVSPSEAEKALSQVEDGPKLWCIEGQILGACLHLMRDHLVERVIFVSAFSCGPASIIEGYIAREADETGTPLLNLHVDEHTGEAGLVTRLEAFLDSAKRPHAKDSSTATGAYLRQRLAPASTASTAPTTWPETGSRSGSLHRVGGRPGPLGLVTMGNLNIPLETLLDRLQVPISAPPPLSDEIVKLGKEIAPEFICYPMVTLIGQMRWHAQRGIDRVLMVQGKGRCRLGWYAQVMQEILGRRGYPMRVLSVDSPFPIRQRWKAFARDVSEIIGEVNALRVAEACSLAFAKMAVLDKAADVVRETRAFEVRRGDADKLYERFQAELRGKSSLRAIAACYRAFRREMKDIPVESKRDSGPLKILLVGEIYVLNEPFVNRDVEKALGSLETRVRVYKTLDVSNWVSCHLFSTPRARLACKEITELAEPYLPLAVGGHGQESVGEAVLAKRKGMDGVLHLFPFTCMPEVIAQNVLVKVSRDLDIPVLSMMISEQTGTAGFITRLEAFCDLLDGRRKAERHHEIER